MEIIQLDDHISAIDHDLLGTAGVGVTYVVRGDEVALVETGTPSTVPATLAGLAHLGIAPEAVSHILCTHIHLDHAGGAAGLAKALPRASVYIGSDVAQYLVEPTKLVAGTRRAVGEQLWATYGEVMPLDPTRLRPSDALRLDLGRGVVLEALATPGHSPDHIAFFERRSGGLFIGDAAGVSMPRWNYVRPITPPPSYDLIAQLTTIAHLRTLPISRLFFTHWSAADDVAGTLCTLHEELEALADGVRAAFDAGDEDAAAIAQRLLPITSTDPDITVPKTWAAMSVTGMLRWEKKRRAN